MKSREALAVAIDLLVQPLGRLAVERGQIGIEEDAPAAHDQDALRDLLDRQRCCGSRGVAGGAQRCLSLGGLPGARIRIRQPATADT